MPFNVQLASVDKNDAIFKLLITYSKELEQYQDNPTGEIASNKYFDFYWIEADRFPFVGYINEELIGFCLLRVEENYYSIAEFYIKPNFRQLGHGKTMIHSIIEFCKEHGKHSSIIADCFIKNSIANNFWTANEFVTHKEVIYEKERSYRNIRDLHGKI